MGGSSSCTLVTPRLLSSGQSATAAWICDSTALRCSFARIALVLSSSIPSVQKSSVAQHLLSSRPLGTAPSSSPMNSLASSVSSSSLEIRFEGFREIRSRRRRHASNLLACSYGDSSSISQPSKCCWRGTRDIVRSIARTNTGRRVECCSSQDGADQPTSFVLPPRPPVTKAKGLRISFCPRCGSATEEKIPVGEHEMRFVCTSCGAVHYQNPKMVVGCLVEHEDQVLLCRRNIEPSHGLWTLPAGYMEIGESAAEGAARETWEEACADVQVLGLFAHLDIPFIGQSYIIFRAQMKNPHFAPGPESLECALFKLSEIPFDKLAFSAIQVALKLYIEDIKAGQLKVYHGVIDKRPGAGPSDLKAFAVRDLLSS